MIDCVCKKEKAALHGHSCESAHQALWLCRPAACVPLSENVLTREEAIKLWNELDAMGTMIVEGFYGFTMGAEEPQFVGGCHCCGCCCAILQGGAPGPQSEGNGPAIELPRCQGLRQMYKPAGSASGVASFLHIPSTRPRMTSRSITGKSASDVVPALWDASLMRFTWSPYRKRSGSMFLPVLSNGKRGAWSFWQRRRSKVRANEEAGFEWEYAVKADPKLRATAG